MLLLTKIDTFLFLALNSLALISPLATVLKLIVNDFFVPVLLSLFLFYLWITPGSNNKKTVVLSVISNALVNTVIKLIDMLYFRPRPFAMLPTHLLFYMPTVSSFPAVPAAVVFAIGSSVYIYDKKNGLFVLTIAAIYSLTRVVVGIHYPSDIIVGGIMGILCSYLLAKIPNFIDNTTSLLVHALKLLGLEPLYD